MNWHAVAVVFFIASALATVVAFAFMMASFEFQPPRRAILYAIPVAILFTVDALLAGVIW